MLLCASFDFARCSLIDRHLLVDWALCAEEEYLLEEFGCDRHWMGVWVVVCAFCCLLL